MPSIGGIEFWISGEFSSDGGGPDNPANPMVVDKRDYSKLYEIAAALDRLFSNPLVAGYLTNLPKKIYISEHDLSSPPFGYSKNAAWVPSGGLNISSSTQFYRDLPKVTLVSGPSGPTMNVDPGYSDVHDLTAGPGYTNGPGHIDIGNQVLSNLSQVFKFSAVDGSQPWMEFDRVLFHELAHGQTRILSTDTYHLGPYDNPDFSVAEAMAADAENLVYVRAFGGSIRIGHMDGLTSASNDPTAAFSNTGDIKFSEGAYGNGGNRAGIIKEITGAGEVQKIYGEKEFSIDTTGTPYEVNNYILIKAISNGPSGILSTGGVASSLLSTVLNGIAHDAVVSNDIISEMGSQIDRLNATGTALQSTLNPSLYRLQEFASLFQTIKYDKVTTAIGLSHDRSFSNLDRTGPYEGSSTAKELYIEAVDGPSLLIGASGTNKLNVNYDNRTDYLRGSAGNDVLIAGTGHRNNKYNTLEGGEGDDILVGRAKNDKLQGGQGNDVFFLSEGNDIIEGSLDALSGTSDTDILIVADRLGQVTLDVSIKENGGSAFSFNGAKSIVKNIDVYMGNASLTTFKGNNENSVFIAGSGGENST